MFYINRFSFYTESHLRFSVLQNSFVLFAVVSFLESFYVNRIFYTWKSHLIPYWKLLMQKRCNNPTCKCITPRNVISYRAWHLKDFHAKVAISLSTCTSGTVGFRIHRAQVGLTWPGAVLRWILNTREKRVWSSLFTEERVTVSTILNETVS